MIKYKFNNKKPTKAEKEEILLYLNDVTFIKILTLTQRYYVQDYNGDYEFLLDIIEGVKYITINIF